MGLVQPSPIELILETTLTLSAKTVCRFHHHTSSHPTVSKPVEPARIAHVLAVLSLDFMTFSSWLVGGFSPTHLKNMRKSNWNMKRQGSVFEDPKTPLRKTGSFTLPLQGAKLPPPETRV